MSFIDFLMADPILRAQQAALLVASSFILFLLLYALRDILQRTHSLPYQLICIIIVAFLPIIGFLIYLIIRPLRTLKEREIEALLLSIAPKKAVRSALEKFEL